MKLNLVFMGGFTYPRGLAGTKRIQNAINALKEYPKVRAQVILQRQSSKDNDLSGVHDGTPYSTVMGDIFGAKMLVVLPILYFRTFIALKKAFRPEYKNVIYFYGPLFFDSIIPLTWAQRLGYKIVFDINEDFGLGRGVSRSIYQRLRYNLLSRFSSRLEQISAGIIVISSYLEEKYRSSIQPKSSVHYMPISVDMDRFPLRRGSVNADISLFYAGTFGKKDGIPILLDAFDKLAEKRRNVNLVLTGRGDKEAMEEFFSRMELSPHKDRIQFKGYLDDKDYYCLLNDSDIPCMTRVDLAFAHAGFPFKLGEFLATGKPVIASRVSDVDRFLVDRHNAMLVKAGSSEDICEAAEFLIENPESAEIIGLQGREVARSFFDYKQQGDSLRTFLESV